MFFWGLSRHTIRQKYSSQRIWNSRLLEKSITAQMQAVSPGLQRANQKSNQETYYSIVCRLEVHERIHCALQDISTPSSTKNEGKPNFCFSCFAISIIWISISGEMSHKHRSRCHKWSCDTAKWSNGQFIGDLHYLLNYSYPTFMSGTKTLRQLVQFLYQKSVSSMQSFKKGKTAAPFSFLLHTLIHRMLHDASLG